MTDVLASQTTAEEDRSTAGHREASALRASGQRRVNILWEMTQAVLTIMIAASVIYLAIVGRESKTLEMAFITIVTMYFTRTNHTKTGGPGGGNVTTER